MTTRLDAVSAATVAPRRSTSARDAPGAEPAGPRKADAAVLRAAREFEAIFVRQLLASAHVGGEKSESGYGAMVVDAMSTGIARAGGLGLARSIDEALSRMALGPQRDADVGTVGVSEARPKGPSGATVKGK